MQRRDWVGLYIGWRRMDWSRECKLEQSIARAFMAFGWAFEDEGYHLGAGLDMNSRRDNRRDTTMYSHKSQVRPRF